MPVIPPPVQPAWLAGLVSITRDMQLKRQIEEAQAKESGAFLSGSGAAGGAASGAMIGTMILPGIGTLIGAGIGAGVGAVAGKELSPRIKPGKGPYAQPGNIQQDNAAIVKGIISTAGTAVTAFKGAKTLKAQEAAINSFTELAVNSGWTPERIQDATNQYLSTLPPDQLNQAQGVFNQLRGMIVQPPAGGGPPGASLGAGGPLAGPPALGGAPVGVPRGTGFPSTGAGGAPPLAGFERAPGSVQRQQAELGGGIPGRTAPGGYGPVAPYGPIGATGGAGSRIINPIPQQQRQLPPSPFSGISAEQVADADARGYTFALPGPNDARRRVLREAGAKLISHPQWGKNNPQAVADGLKQFTDEMDQINKTWKEVAKPGLKAAIRRGEVIPQPDGTHLVQTRDPKTGQFDLKSVGSSRDPEPPKLTGPQAKAKFDRESWVEDGRRWWYEDGKLESQSSGQNEAYEAFEKDVADSYKRMIGSKQYATPPTAAQAVADAIAWRQAVTAGLEQDGQQVPGASTAPGTPQGLAQQPLRVRVDTFLKAPPQHQTKETATELIAQWRKEHRFKAPTQEMVEQLTALLVIRNR